MHSTAQCSFHGVEWSSNRTVTAAQALARPYAIFLSKFLPANLPLGEYIDLSTNTPSLASLALRAHCNSTKSLFTGLSTFNELVLLSIAEGVDRFFFGGRGNRIKDALAALQKYSPLANETKRVQFQLTLTHDNT